MLKHNARAAAPAAQAAMKATRWGGIIALSALVLLGLAFSGCGPALRTEERIVELPPKDAGASLSRASQIGQELIGAGFFAEVRRRFPGLTDEQFQGLFLRWNEEQAKGRVFLSTGVRYQGELPQAKAIADCCESLVRAAVKEAFGSL